LAAVIDSAVTMEPESSSLRNCGSLALRPTPVRVKLRTSSSHGRVPTMSSWSWDARQVLISRKAPASTHGLGVAEAIELARVLGRLPARLQVYVIEGQRFEHGAKISPELHSGIVEVVHRIVDAVSATVPPEDSMQPMAGIPANESPTATCRPYRPCLLRYETDR